MPDPGHSESLLSILIPVYNERAYLRRCIEKVLAAPLPDGLQRELVMVDDASTDGTTDLMRQIAEKHSGVIRAFYQEKNQGKGAAIRRAIQEMKGQYAIFQDADLEYDPDEYGVVLEPLLRGHADVVYGSRFAASPMRKVLNYHHQLGNQLLTHASNFFTGLNLTDMETCYKAFRADILKTIPIRSNRFGLEPEITAKIAKRGCTVYEVPISYHGRSYAEGKKIGWKDGVSAFHKIVKFWLLDDCIDERYGHEVLDSLADARRFSRWMVSVIEPCLGDRILEVGSGIGNITRFLPKKEHLTVTDIDPVYLELLNNVYADNDLVDVKKLDLSADDDFAALGEAKYDSVVCLNVLEHIEDDLAALKRMKTLLAPGGKLILLVPQYRALYGSYDKHLDHFRRYDKQDAVARLTEAGFAVRQTRSFNTLAILGWWFNSCVLKRETMGKYQIKLFDMLVPLLKPAESLLPLPGLSLICVAEA
jgi:glycosyltransferase involved in cell wall biosynthesis